MQGYQRGMRGEYIKDEFRSSSLFFDKYGGRGKKAHQPKGGLPFRADNPLVHEIPLNAQEGLEDGHIGAHKGRRLSTIPDGRFKEMIHLAKDVGVEEEGGDQMK